MQTSKHFFGIKKYDLCSKTETQIKTTVKSSNLEIFCTNNFERKKNSKNPTVFYGSSSHKLAVKPLHNFWYSKINNHSACKYQTLFYTWICTANKTHKRNLFLIHFIHLNFMQTFLSLFLILPISFNHLFIHERKKIIVSITSRLDITIYHYIK